MGGYLGPCGEAFDGPSWACSDFALQRPFLVYERPTPEGSRPSTARELRGPQGPSVGGWGVHLNLKASSC